MDSPRPRRAVSRVPEAAEAENRARRWSENPLLRIGATAVGAVVSALWAGVFAALGWIALSEAMFWLARRVHLADVQRERSLSNLSGRLRAEARVRQLEKQKGAPVESELTGLCNDMRGQPVGAEGAWRSNELDLFCELSGFFKEPRQLSLVIQYVSRKYPESGALARMAVKSLIAQWITRDLVAPHYDLNKNDPPYSLTPLGRRLHLHLHRTPGGPST